MKLATQLLVASFPCACVIVIYVAIHTPIGYDAIVRVSHSAIARQANADNELLRFKCTRWLKATKLNATAKD